MMSDRKVAQTIRLGNCKVLSNAERKIVKTLNLLMVNGKL